MKVGVAADVYIVYKSVYKEFERAVLDKKNLTFVTKRWLSKFTFGFHLWFLCYSDITLIPIQTYTPSPLLKDCSV